MISCRTWALLSVMSPYVPVAQWIERWPAEPEIGGSSPLGHTTLLFTTSSVSDEVFHNYGISILHPV